MNTVTYKDFYQNSKHFIDKILKNEEIIIIKNKKPAYKIIPIQQEDNINLLKDSIIFENDVISPINENWNSLNGNS